MLAESSRVARVNTKSYYIRTFGSIRLRVANALLEHPKASSGLAVGAVAHCNQHELANAAGTVREVVALALSALKRDGIVDVRTGEVVILHPERLEREVTAGLALATSELRDPMFRWAVVAFWMHA